MAKDNLKKHCTRSGGVINDTEVVEYALRNCFGSSTEFRRIIGRNNWARLSRSLRTSSFVKVHIKNLVYHWIACLFGGRIIVAPSSVCGLGIFAKVSSSISEDASGIPELEGYLQNLSEKDLSAMKNERYEHLFQDCILFGPLSMVNDSNTAYLAFTSKRKQIYETTWGHLFHLNMSVGCHPRFGGCANIERGKEIFVYYGSSYWI